MTAYCPAHPWGDAIGLCCVRSDAHLTGHVFAASDCPDRHTDEVCDD